ncbi:MAG: hypothetical protein K2Z81_23080 [Cyanobacteria bacterium]|nr:hypothetical protein [Cyanobacteriota bacterium]
MILTRLDIDAIIDKHDGNRLFLKALTNTGKSSPALIQLLAQYTQFNSIFGSGVANLAGEVAGRQDLFRDSNEPISLIADRSCDVAATIFFAAIDEFAQRKTHRCMAQETLRQAWQFFGLTSSKSEKFFRLMPGTEIATHEVTRGYCLNRSVSAAELFKGIGFHIGSELLADEEFNILDKYLKQHHPQLVKHLLANKAYAWVAVHTTVEAEHFDAAVKSAQVALEFFTGDRDQAFTWILNGISNFATVQTQFMNELMRVSDCRVDDTDNMVPESYPMQMVS